MSIKTLDYSKRSPTGGLYDLLESTRSQQYNNYIRLYYIDEYMVDKDSAGQFTKEKNGFSASDSQYKPGMAFCFASSGTETGGHEVGHSLGLAHTFEGVRGQAQYTYQGQQTDNLMDYVGVRNSLYYWQWKIINNQIK